MRDLISHLYKHIFFFYIEWQALAEFLIMHSLSMRNKQISLYLLFPSLTSNKYYLEISWSKQCIECRVVYHLPIYQCSRYFEQMIRIVSII